MGDWMSNSVVEPKDINDQTTRSGMRFKKVHRLLKGDRRQKKVRFIHQHQHIHSITLMCEVLELHRSTYFKYRHTLDSDYPDYQRMKELFRRHKKTLGYNRMTQVLATELGVVMNHKKVLLIMTKYGLRPIYIKKLRPN
jgi:hypothetical protein